VSGDAKVRTWRLEVDRLEELELERLIVAVERIADGLEKIVEVIEAQSQTCAICKHDDGYCPYPRGPEGLNPAMRRLARCAFKET